MSSGCIKGRGYFPRHARTQVRTLQPKNGKISARKRLFCKEMIDHSMLLIPSILFKLFHIPSKTMVGVVKLSTKYTERSAFDITSCISV